MVEYMKWKREIIEGFKELIWEGLVSDKSGGGEGLIKLKSIWKYYMEVCVFVI